MLNGSKGSETVNILPYILQGLPRQAKHQIR